MPFLRVFASAFALLAFLPCCAAQVAFTAGQTLSTGFQRLTGHAIADFNGDGKPDLAVTDVYDTRVVVYLNDGKGGFRAPISTVLNLSNTTGDIAAGDVNEDGKQDLIVGTVAGADQDNVILLGNGDGTFQTAGIMPNSSGFFQGVLVDLNGDKHLDFVCGSNPNLHAWLGDGKGNFTYKPIDNPNVAGPPVSLSVADFNKDGKLDLAVAAFGPNSGEPGDLRLLLGQGDGTFAAPAILNLYPNVEGYTAVAAADFNKDGKPDLAFNFSALAAVALGNGDGTFQAGASQVIFPAQSNSNVVSSNSAAPPIAVADFNGDGTSDIAIAAAGENHLFVDLNDGSGKFPQPKADFRGNIDADTSFVLTADLNGDGLPDLITGSYTTNNVLTFLSTAVKTTPIVTLSTSAAQVITGNAVTLTAKVSSTTGAPTGSVTFLDGPTSLGQANLDSGGQATLSTAGLAMGPHSFTATYSGDDKFNAAISAATVSSAVDFSISLATPSQTIAAGGSASYSLSVTGLAGLTGTLSITCTGLPAGYTCTSSGTSIGSQASTATVTVAATPQAALRPAGSLLFAEPSEIAWAVIPFGCWVALPRRSRWSRSLLSAMLMTAFGLWLSGCGSSSSKSTTYHGTSSFTITASVPVGTQTLSHQASATLTVQ